MSQEAQGLVRIQRSTIQLLQKRQNPMLVASGQGILNSVPVRFFFEDFRHWQLYQQKK